MQQIPSHRDSMRMMFKASTEYKDEEVSDDNTVDISSVSDVMTSDGWKKSKDLMVGDNVLIGEEKYSVIAKIEQHDTTYRLFLIDCT
jgi:hypothetical protein